MATTDLCAATALGANLVGRSNTFWFDLMASTLLISATNIVESSETAIDFGCEIVDNDAGLSHNRAHHALQISS